MERSRKTLRGRLSGMSIVNKMMIGYIAIIFLPVVSFGIYYYNQISESMLEKLDMNRQEVMKQAYYNLKVDLAHFESLYKLLQYNPFVVDYLSGVYADDTESVYNYLRYINPLMEYSVSGNPNLADITIFKLRSDVFPAPSHIVDIDSLPVDIRRQAAALRPNEGMWRYETAEPAHLTAVYYYQTLYDASFIDPVGVLRIAVSPGVFQPFLKALGAYSGWYAYLVTEQGEIVTLAPGASSAQPSRQSTAAADAAGPGDSAVSHRLTIEEFGLEVVTGGAMNELLGEIKAQERYLAAVIILLLLSLSFIYYLLASSVAKRLSRLARHMRSVGEHSLKTYPSTGGADDEIGFLTYSYNAMVRRIEELINNVHRAEALRKEAAFKALQAQVKPHFLYNTLETIRMMAEARNVPEVAGISYSFGQLMRYSLSSSQDETVLAKELEMVRNYLDIHRIRLKGRLQYDISGDGAADRIVCPRFILQPIAENGVVHGISRVRRPVRIGIAVAREEAYTVIAVTDNGAGISAARLEELRRLLNGPPDDTPTGAEGGVGLPNVSQRIKSYYGGGSRVEIDSEAGAGTTVRLFLHTKG